MWRGCRPSGATPVLRLNCLATCRSWPGRSLSRGSLPATSIGGGAGRADQSVEYLASSASNKPLTSWTLAPPGP